MTQQIKAIYENGVFRPLHQPVDLAESVTVNLSVSEDAGYSIEDMIDHELLDYARTRTASLARVPTLQEVRDKLSIIEGSMSELIMAERGDY